MEDTVKLVIESRLKWKWFCYIGMLELEVEPFRRVYNANRVIGLVYLNHGKESSLLLL